LQRFKLNNLKSMRKFLFGLIATFIIANLSFSQDKELSIFKNDNEICLLLKNANGIYDENYIFQLENNTEFNLNNYKTYDYKLFYDGKSLIFNVSGTTYLLTINTTINGVNVLKGFGLSKRNGDFIIEDKTSQKSFFESISERNAKKIHNKAISLECTSGGIGATECSVGSGVGTVNVSCSVSCGAGYYACCDDNTTVCKCIGNKKKPSIIEAKFTLMINPTKDLIKFKGNDFNKYKIRIFNIKGEIFIDNIILSEEITISKLTPDIYIYHIYDEKGYEQEGKLIIKN
jgi:hypothetical protein